MLRQLGQPLEKDPQSTYPRKGEVDLEDSVFVIYLHPRTEPGEPQMPVIASIWPSLQEAKTIADRYIQNGDPFHTGQFEAVSVTEYEMSPKGASASDRHYHQRFPEPPKVLPEDPLERLRRLEEELAETRAKLGLGAEFNTFTPRL